ncbi:hypothetical protein [Candidatus Protochlamydia phocaeensis]|uniref:hypothetical protein n=1 Tax=Candidatus Protochlamydia phocaeensis TaxID=1414722 RepID=UPI000837B559|nr:hypothetical protein [Candidatus Protochlamydia phocaeensis]
MNNSGRIGLVLALVLLLAGCGPRSLDDFKEEGKGITRTLIQELQSIYTRDQLVASTSKLQRLFDKLADVMIAAREFRHKNSQLDSVILTKQDHELSDTLRIELNRIYRLEGGRQIIEKCQESALHRLDACQKRLSKQD